MLTSVIISDAYINEILSIAGYPIINLDDGDFELTKDELKSLCLLPALRDYYNWFPIKNRQEYSTSGTFEIDFPNNNTFNIINARLNTVGQYGSVRTGNPFVDSYNFRRSSSSSYSNAYGTGNDYGLGSANILRSSVNQSYVNKYKSFSVFVDEQNKKLKGYANAQGMLVVTWAEYSSDFDDIPFRRINEVIELCQAYFLEKLVMIRGQENTQIPETFNVDLFADKADELKDKIFTSWKNSTKSVVMSG